jgi:hypothetical protein
MHWKWGRHLLAIHDASSFADGDEHQDLALGVLGDGV